MIIDLKGFIMDERPFWTELEEMLNVLEKMPEQRMSIGRVKRFHYLYRRASADLVKIMTFSSERRIHRYLESLVGRAYGQVHQTRAPKGRFSPFAWFFHTFPSVFRRQVIAFWLSLVVMTTGCVFGGIAIWLDPQAKEALIGFVHLAGDPSERVAREEQEGRDERNDTKGSFSAYLMTHNTRVSIFTLALGMTYGIGTVIVLFSNGAMLGAVAADYMMAGETRFLLGWLLPHGAVEIPAIILAGQAGLVLAGALMGWGRPVRLKNRLREVSGDIVTLIFGIACMLVWAGIVEAFFSQYHEPVMPYGLKIAFGVVELVLLVLLLSRSGIVQKR
jgi:uncharacterized membrane protein SpoIIM required for sporulation